MLALAWSIRGLGILEAPWGRALRNGRLFLGDFFPPETDARLVGTVFQSLLETLQMAFMGTFLGALLALPFAVLATRNISGLVGSSVIRTVLAAIRTIPSLLWALLFIVMVGLGPLAGTLGLAAYTLGYLGKLYYEAFEGVDPEVLEAVRATGTSRWQLARHAILPEAANPLLSQLLFIFEYNVRASSILGIVGAGGIGFYIWEHFTSYYYEAVATDLILLFALVLLIDVASNRLRRRYLIESQTAMPA